jgi:hypothetical protein
MANEGRVEVRRVDPAAARRSEELPLLAQPDLVLADAVLGAPRAPCHHACSVTRPTTGTLSSGTFVTAQGPPTFDDGAHKYCRRTWSFRASCLDKMLMQERQAESGG